MTTPPLIPSPLTFFSNLRWLDGRPLLDTIEPYRREFFTKALYTFDANGVPRFNQILAGRAKKNWKSTDLILAALYRLLVWPVGPAGNDALIIANDESQAGDDLSLAKKLVDANPELAAELFVYQKQLRRRDGRGTMHILPTGDAVGLHGKTFNFLGCDEIHGWRNYDVIEALAPDPTRPDALVWITSYDTVWSGEGIPLHDLKRTGMAGTDPRMLFSWYSGEYCTDPAFADLPPERRANPSMDAWPEGAGYITQQRLRLPSHKFRRLHLNLPGALNGAFFDGGMVDKAIVPGLRSLPYRDGPVFRAFVDMSGGSSDDACLGLAHQDRNGRRILDLVVSQDGVPPFDPRAAVRKFARILREYRCEFVEGDAYAGETFRQDFAAEDISYRVSQRTRTEIYEAFEPELNQGHVELLDVAKLREQLLTLVVRGARVDHMPGAHDDWANAACGAVMAADVRPVSYSDTFRGQPVRVMSPLEFDAWDTRRDANIEPINDPLEGF